MKFSTLILSAFALLLFAGPASVVGSESTHLRGDHRRGDVDSAAVAATEAGPTWADASVALPPGAPDGDGDGDGDSTSWAASVKRMLFLECNPIPCFSNSCTSCPVGGSGSGGGGCKHPNGNMILCSDTCGEFKDGCSAFCPCNKNLSCHPVVQKCYDDPRKEGQPCVAGHPCGPGLTCQPGVHKCYNSPRQEGEPCSFGFSCASGLWCEAGTQTCRKPGDVGDPCHVTRPCKSGLSCQPGVHKCYDHPRKEGQPCSLGFECESGLSCLAGIQKCVKIGRIGDPCHLTRPCGDGLTCGGGNICLPECEDVISSTIAEQIKSGLGKKMGGKWENGVMPYVVDCDTEEHERKWIALGMKAIEDKTDIRFEKYDSGEHINYVIFGDVLKGDCDVDDDFRGVECEVYESLGAGRRESPGWQYVNMNGSAFNNLEELSGTATHEIMHALGWSHTQSRNDRDKYVKIIWDNIKEGNHDGHMIRMNNDVYESVQRCRPYNFKSIMHYQGNPGAQNPYAKDQSKYTITTKDASMQKFLEKKHSKLSSQDVEELQAYFFGPPCPPLPQAPEKGSYCSCLEYQIDYRGGLFETESGKTCMKWESQDPHSHTRTPENYPNSDLISNFCRNPDFEERAWCYTTDPNTRWEYCAVERCPPEKCTVGDTPAPTPPPFEESGFDALSCSCVDDQSDYRGTISRSASGRTCQRWDSQYPHTHMRTPEIFPDTGLEANNYCRNPDGPNLNIPNQQPRAWCYTTDPKRRFDWCNVPRCKPEQCERTGGGLTPIFEFAPEPTTGTGGPDVPGGEIATEPAVGTGVYATGGPDPEPAVGTGVYATGEPEPEPITGGPDPCPQNLCP